MMIFIFCMHEYYKGLIDFFENSVIVLFYSFTEFFVQ